MMHFHSYAGYFLITMSLEMLSGLVDMQDFTNWYVNRYGKDPDKEIVYQTYELYYNQRSEKLAAANALSRGVTIAAKNELELLLNDAAYRGQQAVKWAEFD